jgi:FkbM family methyltransferase
VTRWFYDVGWRGVNVEPDPNYHAALAERRPDDDNVRCAIGAKSGTALLHIVEDTGLSTVSETQALALAEFGFSAKRHLEVPCLSLEDLFHKHVGGRVVDFLKIDAEGAEPDILNAARLQTCRPRILLVEATRPMTQEASWSIWEPHLLNLGYLFAWFDGLNRFYVRREDAWRLEFFRLPPCVFDNFERHNALVAELQRQLAALKHL